jgi:hypothetical protein
MEKLYKAKCLPFLHFKKSPAIFGEEKFSWIIEISVKSGKDSTSTLSLVIHKVRLKIPAKKYISIQQGVKTQETI